MVDEEEWILTAEKFRSVLESTAQDGETATVIAPLLREAIQHYRHGAPPFISQRLSQRRVNGSVPDKSVRLAVKDHLNHDEMKERTIKYRKWNETHGFWTLDLNGKRLILKPMSKGPLGGVRYQSWLDCSRGFASDSVAHTAHSRLKLQASASVESRKSGRDRIPSAAQPTPGAKERLNGTPRARRNAKTKAEEMIKAATEWLLNPSIQQLYHKEEIHGRDLPNVTSRHARSEPPRDDTQRKSSRTRPKPIYSELLPSLNDKPTDRESTSSASTNRRRVVFSTPQPTRVALSSKRTYSATGLKDIATALKRRREAIRQSLPSKGTGEVGLATESTHAVASSLGRGLAHLPRDSDESTSSSDADDSPHDSARSTTIIPNDFAESTQVGGASSPEILTTQPITTEDEDPNPLHLLSSTKLTNTFLLITIPPNPDFKIAKLSSCATVNDITTAILRPFKLDNQIDQIDSFRFKFEWLPATAFYRTLLIEPDQMSSSFDYVVKRIDKAELWAIEGESCYLGVDVLLKKGCVRERERERESRE